MSEADQRANRRKAVRYVVNLDVSVEPMGKTSPSVRASGRVLNVGRDGFMAILNSPVAPGSYVKVRFSRGKSEYPFALAAKIAWLDSSMTDSTRCGITLLDCFKRELDVLQLVESFGPIIPQKDRREGRQEKVFPVRRRSSDGDLMMESHYYSFLEYLHRVSKTERPPLVVVGKGIGYLAERIKSIFPGSRVVIVGTLADRIPDGSLIVLNLDCRRRHEAFSFLDFREVAVKTGGRQEPLETLSRVSELTSAGTRLNLVSLGKIHNQDIARKFLRVSKFEEAVFTGDHTVRVKKRELYHQKFGNGSYVVEEVQGREDVDKIQAFSERFFSKDYNFSKIVDDLFTNHSDFYRITDLRTHAIVTCARVTWHLPNHYLPCMLAHKAETDEHLQLNKPDKLSYIEIYAPYFTSVASARNYGEFLKIFLNYGERGVADVAFTTYNAGSPHEGKIFHRTFGFKETGLTLKYGDFGGDWELVYCTVGTFRENVKVKLVSSVNMPSILKKYVKGR